MNRQSLITLRWPWVNGLAMNRAVEADLSALDGNGRLRVQGVIPPASGLGAIPTPKNSAAALELVRPSIFEQITHFSWNVAYPYVRPAISPAVVHRLAFHACRLSGLTLESAVQYRDKGGAPAPVSGILKARPEYLRR